MKTFRKMRWLMIGHRKPGVNLTPWMLTRIQNPPKSAPTVLGIPVANSGDRQKASLREHPGVVRTVKELFPHDAMPDDQNEGGSRRLSCLILRMISRSVVYSRMRWQVHGMAYIQSRRGRSVLLAYVSTFISCNLESPAAPPSASTVRLVTTSTAITTSVATPVGTATTTSVKSWNVCSFCCDLYEPTTE